MCRNMDENPYTKDELRVVEYLREIIPEVGACTDPIGFLISSHATIRQEKNALAMEGISLLQRIMQAE